MQLKRQYPIIKCTSQNVDDQDDWVAVEEPLEMWIKYYDQHFQPFSLCLNTTMRTPGDDLHLVKGWLFTAGVVALGDIDRISATGTEYLKQKDSNRILVTLHPRANFDPQRFHSSHISLSSCGVCGQNSIDALTQQLSAITAPQQIYFSRSFIYSLPQAFFQQNGLFAETGNCHSVALLDAQGNIVDIQEDIGRHNALDKLIGANYHLFPGKFAVMLSGRVSFEMVQKSARAGISMIIALGAPTSLAIDLCKECDIALLGFVNSKRFNIYHGKEQILGDG